MGPTLPPTNPCRCTHLVISYCPNAAAGYVLFLRAVELLLELLGPVEPPALPGGGVGDRRLVLLLFEELLVAATGFCTMSSGRSFHSVSGRAFWKESDEEAAEEADVVVSWRGGALGICGGGCDIAGRFMADDNTDDVVVLVALEEGIRAAGAVVPGPMSRRMIHAVSGRSLK